MSEAERTCKEIEKSEFVGTAMAQDETKITRSRSFSQTIDALDLSRLDVRGLGKHSATSYREKKEKARGAGGGGDV